MYYTTYPKKGRETPTSGQKGGKTGCAPMWSRDLRSRHMVTSGSPIGYVTNVTFGQGHFR